MSETVPGTPDIDALIERIRRLSESRTAAAAEAPAPAAAESSSTAHRQALAPMPEETASLPRPISAGVFQSFHDEIFLRLLYRELLHREPEPEALAHHLALLRSGASTKLDLIAGIRYSPEGLAANVPVPGLDRAWRLRRVFRFPVVGPLLESVFLFLRLPAVVANQQRLEADCYRRFGAIHEAFRLELLGPLDAKADKTSVAELQRHLARMAFHKADRQALLDLEARLAALDPTGRSKA